MISVSGAIFAGGKSERFGSPKINALFNGVEFGQLIVEQMKKSQILNISLVGGESADAARWKINYLPDQFVDAGPLGALITALRACTTEILMILPCDVPFINAATCKLLSEITNGYQVRVAQTDSPQWLCSAWDLRLLSLIEEQYAKGERAIHCVATLLRTEFVSVDKNLLRNINSTSDLGD